MRVFLTPETNLGQAITILRTAFAEAGLDTPDLDARFLALHALKLGDSEFYAARDRPLRGSCSVLTEAIHRRLAREPVARILGVWEFWSLPFGLNAATLVPRPDTETIVEAALKEVDRAGRRYEPLRILDIGTGSGAILIALLSELPRAFGVGVDLSLPAVEMARSNARRNNVFDRAAFVVGNWAEALGRRFDIVVSNPPYIPSATITEAKAIHSQRVMPGVDTRHKAGHDVGLDGARSRSLVLDPEVLNCDPLLALDGGADGLDAYRIIAQSLPDLLASDGIAILELGIGQAAEVGTLLRDAGFTDPQTRPDLAGIERALIARAY